MIGDTRERSVMSWVVSARAARRASCHQFNRATPMNVKRLDAVPAWTGGRSGIRASV